MGEFKVKIAESWRSTFNLRIMAIVVCAMVFAVLAGPFGTLTQLSFWERVLLWVPTIALSLVLGWMSNLVAQLVLKDGHLFAIEAFAVVLMTLLFAPFVVAFTHVLNPSVIENNGGVARLSLSVFAVVAGVGIVRCAILAWRDETVLPQSSSPVDDQSPRLLQRLPSGLDGPILRLSARDHRVEVVTKNSMALLRIRLSDAVAEMNPVEGFMTHRSHWVAKSAVVQAVKREPGKVYLELTNGDLVPVSRTFRPDWIEAGFLETNGENGTKHAMQSEASGRPEEQDRSKPRLPPRA